MQTDITKSRNSNSNKSTCINPISKALKSEKSAPLLQRNPKKDRDQKGAPPLFPTFNFVFKTMNFEK